jgi:hypothetical protein
MHSTIKQGYVAPSVAKSIVATVTLGTVSLNGEPALGYHV